MLMLALLHTTLYGKEHCLYLQFCCLWSPFVASALWPEAACGRRSRCCPLPLYEGFSKAMVAA